MSGQRLGADTGGAFRIEGNHLVVADNPLLDFETHPIANLTIRATSRQWRGDVDLGQAAFHAGVLAGSAGGKLTLAADGRYSYAIVNERGPRRSGELGDQQRQLVLPFGRGLAEDPFQVAANGFVGLVQVLGDLRG
jgi:hypothetical protein